jgi:hypothetical protein
MSHFPFSGMKLREALRVGPWVDPLRDPEPGEITQAIGILSENPARLERWAQEMFETDRFTHFTWERLPERGRELFREEAPAWVEANVEEFPEVFEKVMEIRRGEGR